MNGNWKALAAISTLLVMPLGLIGSAVGKTKVLIDGKDITITVPIDGVGIDKQTAAEWKQSAESLWNAAFNAADNPFKGCLTLKLVVDVQAHDYSYPAQQGRHMIFGTHGSAPNQAKGTVLTYGEGRGDNVNPYQAAADGNFDESFGDPSRSNYVAHEVGHLLGLGDDYTETGTNPRTTTPLPGREHTLMADGGRIDPALLKRLIKLLRDATHQIPDCLKGKLGWSAHQTMPSGPQDWNGYADLTLDDDGRGALKGTMVGAQTQKLGLAMCHAVTNGTVRAILAGTRNAQKITVNVTEQQHTWPATTPCAEGKSAGTGGVVFAWPQFAETLRGLSSSGDGGYSFDREFGIPSGTTRFTLTLRPTGD
jgi:hypothetical protein